MSKPPRGIARFDSSAAMVTALSNALHQRPFSSPSQSPGLDRVLPALNLLPERLREWGYAVGGMSEGITLAQAQQLDIEGIARWVAGQYPQQHYQAAFVGSSNGAMVHLAAAMGVPWLPQTFLCPVRSSHNDPDDAQQGFTEGKPIVDALLATSPHIAVHQMQDPNQDRLMLEQMSYFRLKHRKLPLEYNEFLLSALPPGGTLVINHCTQQWPATRTSDRSFYQFGSLGGATEQEYFEGGPRVMEHLARYGSDREKWQPPAPDVTVPEAEWGFDAHLMAELKKLANSQGWKLVELRYENPEALSFVAAEIYRDWYMSAGIIASRLVVDNFLLMDPWTTMHQRRPDGQAEAGHEKTAAGCVAHDRGVDLNGVTDRKHGRHSSMNWVGDGLSARRAAFHHRASNPVSKRNSSRLPAGRLEEQGRDVLDMEGG